MEPDAMTWTTRMMSDRHEEALAVLFSGRSTKGSGNQWHDQLDGKQAHGSGHVVLAWDGKSTLGESIGVSKRMWNKAVEQTRPWETPMLALRFYADERLSRVALDLVVVEAGVLADLQKEADEVIALRDRIESMEVCFVVGHRTTQDSGTDCARCGLSALAGG